MKFNSLLVGTLLFCQTNYQAQKEFPLTEPISDVTVFFTGAQLKHKYNVPLKPGKQTVVLQKLTDFLDPNTIQIKAPKDLVILSVRMRKNFEDITLNNQQITTLNAKIHALDQKYDLLINEYAVLELDRKLILLNRNLGSQTAAVKVTELKEAYAFMHQKMMEIIDRELVIKNELERITKESNILAQELTSQRSKPVINYSEVVVELDSEKPLNAELVLTYMTPKATWKPIYNMRSEGIGKNVKLEAQANVSQNTGLDWSSVKVSLSTSDPYQNATENILAPWYINYNNYQQPKYIQEKNLPEVDYSGQKLRGEIIDAESGESMPFTKVSFPGFPNVGAISDMDGKFEITVPKDANSLQADFVGYNSQTLSITAPYLKFFLIPNEIDLEEVLVATEGVQNSVLEANSAATYQWTTVGDIKEMDALDIETRGARWKRKSNIPYKGESDDFKPQAFYVNTVIEDKQLMVEYQVNAKMDIPTDGIDHKVSIANYELPANYEYHCAPKIDPHVFLSAQLTGWEKLNLLSGPSSIYFDGTYMGETFLDLNTTKDTLNLSFGTDSKMTVERTRVTDKTKTKHVGSRTKVDIAWEILIKNNGTATIPFVMKDQFPVSTNADIKVKRGELNAGGIGEENNGIITWKFKQGIPKNEKITFDYSVDYEKGYVIYLE
jgi:hypothetical protein